jgi:Na+/H+ antiporter NhaD/arsenite permease-like protein
MTDFQQTVVLSCFVLTYWVMATGKLPGLRIDRAGIALAAAGLLLALNIVAPGELLNIIDLPVLITLFSLMVVGAHLEQAKAFDLLTRKLAAPGMHPPRLLAVVISLSALFSMVLVNDIVVFALAPILCMVCLYRGFDPKPQLLAMAAASNAGSAASLIGNPQNILIAEVGQLVFIEHFLFAAVPALLALVVIYGVVRLVFQHGLSQEGIAHDLPTENLNKKAVILPALGVLSIVLAYLLVPAQGWQVALGVAVLLTLFGRLNTRELLPALDVPLLIMIAGLMVVTGSFSEMPQLAHIMNQVEQTGLLPNTVWPSVVFSILASNTIGNVPAVVLLLNVTDAMGTAALNTEALHMLALFSTLAGNLFLTGSLANIITAERAAQQGIQLGFADFARMGVAVTFISMALAAAWVIGF